MTLPVLSLAIPPFENLSGLEHDTRLARGFVQDLIAELARFPAFGVIAADSVFTAGQEGKNAAEIAQALGVRYFLRGSIRRMEERLRISLQLLEADTGAHLWAGRFDEEQLPWIPDEVVARVANALALKLDQSLLRAARRRPATTLEAYECWLRGMECLYRGTVEADEEGRQFFEQALRSDPHYARAHAGLSLSHFNEWSCQAWDCWERKERLAYLHATTVEQLDPDDAVVQVILARVEQYRRTFDRSGPRLERAESLAPNDAHVLVQLAAFYAFQGMAARGHACGQRALALNPLCPAWFYGYAALPLFALRRYEAFLDLVAKAPPAFMVDMPAYQAAASAYLGQSETTADFLRAFREAFLERIAPGREPTAQELLRWTLHVNPYRQDEDVCHLAEGLRLAGLEVEDESCLRDEPVAWPVANIFRREGPCWTLSFDHVVVRLPEMRGLSDLARLLARPGEDVPATELAGLTVESSGLERLDPRVASVPRTDPGTRCRNRRSSGRGERTSDGGARIGARSDFGRDW